MDEREQLKRKLEELKKTTGLSLTFEEGAVLPEDVEEKLSMLTSAWKEKYDRTNFLRNLLYGHISETDLYAAASRFHIPEHALRILYVIECRGETAEDAARVLKQMFPLKSGDQLAVLDERRIILIRALTQKDREDVLLSEARTIADMLSMEAMISARVGFDAPSVSLRDMPRAYEHALLALEIGRVFYGSDTVLQYTALGVGRLIHDLPEDTCRMFLQEVFGDGSPDNFDEETVTIINAFFENNLNISETARQLYVHRNTLVYRLEKLHQATGLDLRNFDDALELKLAMMISGSIKAKRAQRGGS